jgi:hypothetical protein
MANGAPRHIRPDRELANTVRGVAWEVEREHTPTEWELLASMLRVAADEIDPTRPSTVRYELTPAGRNALEEPGGV